MLLTMVFGGLSSPFDGFCQKVDGGGVLGFFFEELGEKKIPAQNFKLGEDRIAATPKRVITSVTY